ncbi:cytochrome P450 [Diaporthe sp. PMI_573]|nr:cytochrome P450 [Diaporthaceae sp. PMI_573]
MRQCVIVEISDEVWLAFRILVALYNISPLHPLSHFPGPKLAHMTLCYEAWFDLVKGGQYTGEIRKMHEQYGPIVRISPSELHCNDPSFIDEIYAVGGRERNKSPHFCQSLVAPIDRAGFETVDHNLYRARRSPMARQFSRQHLLRFKPEIVKQLQYFCDKLITYKGQKPFDITMAYSCFTTNVISAFSFGEPLGLLTQQGWEPNWRQPTYSFLKTTFLFRYIPILKRLVAVGNFFVRRGWMGPDVKMVLDTVHTRIPKMISKTLEAGIAKERKNLFQDILESKSIPESDKLLSRYLQKAWCSSMRPAILTQLTAELMQAFPEKQIGSWIQLEKLPYLGAVILKGLRLSYGVSGRTPRIANQEDLVYCGNINGMGQVKYVIPRGWPVGMSSAVMHHNHDIFPKSEAFLPERWLDQDANRNKALERCLLSFSRGSRQCLGIHLAYCELYLAVALLTLSVFPRMTLVDTTEDDIRYDHDLLVPMTKKGSQGVRVIVL